MTLPVLALESLSFRWKLYIGRGRNTQESKLDENATRVRERVGVPEHM
jgi:hypothetical protein